MVLSSLPSTVGQTAMHAQNDQSTNDRTLIAKPRQKQTRNYKQICTTIDPVDLAIIKKSGFSVAELLRRAVNELVVKNDTEYILPAERQSPLRLNFSSGYRFKSFSKPFPAVFPFPSLESIYSVPDIFDARGDEYILDKYSYAVLESSSLFNPEGQLEKETMPIDERGISLKKQIAHLEETSYQLLHWTDKDDPEGILNKQICEMNLKYASDLKAQEEQRLIDEAYKKGLLEGAVYSPKIKNEETDEEDLGGNLKIKDIATLITEKESDFIAFCKTNRKHQLLDVAKMKQYIKAQKDHLKNISEPDHLLDYQNIHPNKWPTANAKKGMSKLIYLLAFQKIRKINGYTLAEWRTAMDEMEISEDRNESAKHEAKKMSVADFADFYNKVGVDQKAFAYLCALSGIRYNQLHRFLMLPDEEKRQHMTVIRASDEKAQLNYNNKLIGDVLVLDLNDVGIGKKEVAYAVLPANCEELVLGMGAHNMHKRPETYSTKTKQIFDEINERRRKEMSAVEFDGVFSFKTLRKFHTNYLCTDLQLDENIVDLLEGRELAKTVGRSNYHALLHRCVIAYSPIADHMSSLVEFPPLPRDNDGVGKRT